MSERVRTGKIARLPQKIRDQLNQRLRDNEQGKALVAWLNSLPEVQALLKADFGGREIAENNLTEWKQGGYHEWELQQEAVEAIERMDADADELNKASETPIIDLLMKRLAARYAVVAQALNRSNGEGKTDVQLLHKLCCDVVTLRRSDQGAERLQIEHDRLEFEQDQLNKMRSDQLMEWAFARREEVLSYIKTRLRERERFIQKALNGDEDYMEAGEEADRLEALFPQPDKKIQPDST